MVNELNFPEKNIIIFGRSIGTGPATHLAARRSPAALILMSAYISIKAVVVHLIGRFLAALVADRFKNIDEIQKVKVPTFFLHGKKDDLIPCYHSKELYNKSHIGEYWFPNDMTHNSFNIIKDLLIPIDNFLEKYKYQIKNETIYKGFKFLNINDIANLHELEKLNNEGNVTNSIFKGKK